MSNTRLIEDFIEHTERIVAAVANSEDDKKRSVERFGRTMRDPLRRFLKAFAGAYPDSLFHPGRGALQMADAFYRSASLPHPEDFRILIDAWDKAWFGRGGKLYWRYAPDSTLTLCFSPKHEGGYREVAFAPEDGDIPLSFPLKVSVTVWEDMDEHPLPDDSWCPLIFEGGDVDECHCDPRVNVSSTRVFTDNEDWKGFSEWLSEEMKE